MSPLTIPKNFKFKPFFRLLANATTIVGSVDVEMVLETLIFNTINLVIRLKKPLIPSPKS